MMRKRLPVTLENRVRIAAQNRCGYCLCPQHLLMARLNVEHIVPLAKGGTDDEGNLWLACPICNGHKADKIDAVDPETQQRFPLFNPRAQQWFEHFAWASDAIHVEGKTAVGRATITALKLNDDADALTVRAFWVMAGWHPPKA